MVNSGSCTPHCVAQRSTAAGTRHLLVEENNVDNVEWDDVEKESTGGQDGQRLTN